jgi:hypothetical protein
MFIIIIKCGTFFILLFKGKLVVKNPPIDQARTFVKILFISSSGGSENNSLINSNSNSFIDTLGIKNEISNTLHTFTQLEL